MQHRYKCSNILVSWSIHTAHDNIQNVDVCEMLRAQCLQCLCQTVGRASKVWGVLSPTPCHYFIPTTPVTCSASSLMVIDEACELWHAHWPRVIILYPQVLLTWPKWPTVVIQRGSCDGALKVCIQAQPRIHAHNIGDLFHLARDMAMHGPMHRTPCTSLGCP